MSYPNLIPIRYPPPPPPRHLQSPQAMYKNNPVPAIHTRTGPDARPDQTALAIHSDGYDTKAARLVIFSRYAHKAKETFTSRC